MPLSRLRRVLALFALIVVALAFAFAGDPAGDGGGSSDPDGSNPPVVDIHFGW